MTPDPIITRFAEGGDKYPGFMAHSLGGQKELVVAEYSERGLQALKDELSRREAVRLEIEALKRRPEVIEGEFAK